MSNSQNTGVFYAKIDNVKTCNISWTVQLYDDHVYEDFDSHPDSKWSPTFSAESNSIKWQLMFCPAVVNMYRPLINVFYDSEDEIRTHGPIAGEFTISVINAEGEKSDVHRHNFLLTNDTISPQNLGCITEDDDILIMTDDGKPLDDLSLPEESLTLMCQVHYFQAKSIVGLVNQCNLNSIETHNPLDGFENAFLNPELSDVTICVKGTEYPGHKVILSSRSKVFEAMFKHGMIENQSSRIEVNDIDEEVFLQVLRYIYTGKAQNLNNLASQLLPVADRYDLEKLKILCGNVLLGKLSNETAVSILILADMCNATELKNRSAEFIKLHSKDVAKATNTEDKKELMSRPHLLTNSRIRSLFNVKK